MKHTRRSSLSNDPTLRGHAPFAARTKRLEEILRLAQNRNWMCPGAADAALS